MLGKSSLVVFAALGVHALTSFGFTMIMGRSLSLDHFGALSTLISVQTVFSIPVGALILYYSRHAASLKAGGNPEALGGLYAQSWKVCAVAGAVAAVLVAAGSVFLHDELQVGIAAALAAAAMVAAYFLQAPGLAFVRGLGRFYLFAGGLGGGGLLKIILALAVIAAGIADSFSAVLAITVSVLFSAILLHVLLRAGMPKGRLPGQAALSLPAMFYLAGGMAGTLFPILFLNVDMVLVRYYFPPEISGHYGAFGLVGKIMFLIAQVVGIAMFPAVVAGEMAGSDDSTPLVFKGLAILSSAGAAVAAACFMFPDELLRAVIKVEDPAAADALGYYAVSALAVGALFVESNYQLARRRHGFIFSGVAGAAAQVGGIIWFSGSLMGIVRFQAALFTAVAVWRLTVLALEKPSPGTAYQMEVESGAGNDG